MTSQYNTAEGGVNGTTPTTSDTGSGTALGVVTAGAVSTVQYSNAHPAHGGLGYKLANNTTTAEIAKLAQLDSGGGATSVFGSFYYTCDVAPSGTLRVARFRKNSGGIVGSIFQSTSNFLQIRQGSDANPPVYTFTNALTAGTIYRVEWNVIVDGTTSATIQVKLYLGDSATALEDSTAKTVTTTANVSAVDLTEYGGGVTSSARWPNSGTGAQYFDDLKSFYTDWTGAVATTDVSITAAVASATAAAGTFTTDSTLSPPLATATASALTPTVGTSANITIPAAVASATAAGLTPALRIDASVVAAIAAAIAEAPAPSFRAGSSATIVSPVAISTAAGLAPTPSIAITSVIAGATAAALAPSLAMKNLPGACTGTAAGLAPTITVDRSLTAVIATATADFLAPRVASAFILAAAQVDTGVMVAATTSTGSMSPA